MGDLSLEESGRRTVWPRKMELAVPYGDGRAKYYSAHYDIYDWKSNPSCDLQICQSCHQPWTTGCASDCRNVRNQRSEQQAAARKQEREIKDEFRAMAQEARSGAIPTTPCPDFLLGLCRAQGIGKDGAQAPASVRGQGFDRKCVNGRQIGV